MWMLPFAGGDPTCVYVERTPWATRRDRQLYGKGGRSKHERERAPGLDIALHVLAMRGRTISIIAQCEVLLETHVEFNNEDIHVNAAPCA